jgi:hypothetical protein
VSTYKAHIFKQRNVGEREEVKLKIFGPDGEELDLSGGGGGGSPEPVEIPDDIQLRMTSGQSLWYTPGEQGNAVTPFANDLCNFSPMRIKKGVTLDRIGILVVTPGNAGSLIRLGIYSDTGGGLPGDLLVDSGPLDGTLAEFHAAEIDLVVDDTLIWLACLVNNAEDTRPSLDGMGNATGFPEMVGKDAFPQRACRCAYYSMGRSGFHSPASDTDDLQSNSVGPRVCVRVA